MRSATDLARGKLNLLLDVVGKRPDGYHEMKMVMQTVSLCDTVTVCVETGKPWECVCDVPGVPFGESNLAYRAAALFFETVGRDPQGLRICIEKKIPMQGGMAGGSADAAAVLRILNGLYDCPLTESQLCELGAALGSDIPYCIIGGTVLAEGRGERLTPLKNLPEAWFVLLKPEFSVSTPWLFRQLDGAPEPLHPHLPAALAALVRGDLSALCGEMRNVFQPILAGIYPEIDTLCKTLRERGAMAACLTGTGSVVFGVFDREEKAAAACGLFREEHIAAFLAKNE